MRNFEYQKQHLKIKEVLKSQKKNMFTDSRDAQDNLNTQQFYENR